MVQQQLGEVFKKCKSYIDAFDNFPFRNSVLPNKTAGHCKYI